MYKALIPVKSLAEAKSRLANDLTQEQRGMLVLDMLQHVITVLYSSDVIDGVTVVSPDHYVLEKATVWGAYAQIEEEHGHNPALRAAASRELAAGASALLTISADLPLLHPHDIRRMVEQSRLYDVVLAPSWDGTGTNALLMRPPLAVPYVFGVGSLRRYIVEVKKARLSVTLYNSIGVALDVDTRDDLELFHCYETEGKAMYASCYA